MTDKQRQEAERLRKEQEKALVEEVLKDFERRKEERRSTERQWQLNMNFVTGNQYCDVNAVGELVEEDTDYVWQYKRVFNHIAPVIDTRLAKLARIRPQLAVRAASSDESDLHAAKLGSAIVASAAEENRLETVTEEATTWAEYCGAAFYKIVWDNGGGNVVGMTEEGKRVTSGSARIVAVSPFEIFPDSLSVEKLDEQPSLIHAKALPVKDIETLYGVRPEGRDLETFCPLPGHSTTAPGMTQATLHGYETVVEKYERPSADHPQGRLIVVAGDRLVYDGELPYPNGMNGERGYPFVRQVCIPVAGRFFGGTIVERLIPVQRAYNAVKNRKQEFLNRIAMGAVAVEDGSVNLEELQEDGLTPGKILVYRQGSKPPEMLSLGSVPSEFEEEEASLQKEFYTVAGIRDVSSSSSHYASVTSATGLQLIIEEDESRLKTTYDSIKSAIKQVGQHVLRLYRRFATDGRLIKAAGDNGEIKLYYFKGSDISSDDVTIVAESDYNLTSTQRRNVLYEMMDRGLFSDENGNIPSDVKQKILDELGYGSFMTVRNVEALHRAEADKENLAMAKGIDSPVKAYDDHAVHAVEHTAFLLSEELDEKTERRLYAHIEQHQKAREEQQNG